MQPSIRTEIFASIDPGYYFDTKEVSPECSICQGELIRRYTAIGNTVADYGFPVTNVCNRKIAQASHSFHAGCLLNSAVSSLKFPIVDGQEYRDFSQLSHAQQNLYSASEPVTRKKELSMKCPLCRTPLADLKLSDLFFDPPYYRSTPNNYNEMADYVMKWLTKIEGAGKICQKTLVSELDNLEANENNVYQSWRTLLKTLFSLMPAAQYDEYATPDIAIQKASESNERIYKHLSKEGRKIIDDKETLWLEKQLTAQNPQINKEELIEYLTCRLKSVKQARYKDDSYNYQIIDNIGALAQEKDELGEQIYILKEELEEKDKTIAALRSELAKKTTETEDLKSDHD